MAIKIVFAGTPEFAVPTLQALINSKHSVVAVYTQPDRHSGRGQHVHASPIKECALKHNLPVYQPESLRDASAVSELRSLAFDLLVVVAYGQILSRDILDIPNYGCMNVHASLLPRWRGAAPIQHAILKGDAVSGVTIMQMSEGLDTGDMLLKKSCDIVSGESSKHLHDRLSSLGAEALIETLSQLESQTLNPIVQNETEATYAKKLTKHDGLIRWEQSAEEIARHVHAFNPWPVCFTHWKGDVFRVWNASAKQGSSEHPPGTVVHVDDDAAEVVAGSGILVLREIQLPGKRAMSVKDFLNAHRSEIIPGQTQFGSQSC